MTRMTADKLQSSFSNNSCLFSQPIFPICSQCSFGNRGIYDADPEKKTWNKQVKYPQYPITVQWLTLLTKNFVAKVGPSQVSVNSKGPDRNNIVVSKGAITFTVRGISVINAIGIHTQLGISLEGEIFQILHCFQVGQDNRPASTNRKHLSLKVTFLWVLLQTLLHSWQ